VAIITVPGGGGQPISISGSSTIAGSGDGNPSTVASGGNPDSVGGGTGVPGITLGDRTIILPSLLSNDGGVSGDIFLVEGGSITETIPVDSASTFSAPNFNLSEEIVLNGVAAISETYDNGQLTLAAPSGSISLAVSGPELHSISDFSFQVDLTHGTTVITEVACYRRGTLILTETGQVPVEDLAIGDRVTTSSGEARPVKWIGHRSYSGRFVLARKDILPICIKAGALDENVPRRDLWISPHHAMYLDGVLIESQDLVNGVSIVQADKVDEVEYFHIELETHDVIVAEGALSETFVDDDSRGMFHNALEFSALYPDDIRQPAHYCAPRRGDGYEVDTARRRIALRAGLSAADDAQSVGTLRGSVDHIGRIRIAGWAQNVDHPEAPVCLDIYADSGLIGQTVANQYREDLEQAGLGSGRHGFTFTPRRSTPLCPMRLMCAVPSMARCLGDRPLHRHRLTPAFCLARSRAIRRLRDIAAQPASRAIHHSCAPLPYPES
jgi:hypothetical protein